MTKINVGDKFNRLTVIEDLGFFKKEGHLRKRHWYKCKCDCGNIKDIEMSTLKRGTTKSCGCLNEEVRCTKKSHKYNKYYIYNDIAFVKFSNCNEIFIIDLEELNMIKQKTWYKNKQGYAVSDTDGRFRLNRFIMNPKECEYVDHISGYLNDYRKSNLRNITPQKSAMNIGKKVTNTSGHTGVHKNKKGLYEAYISVDKNKLHLGKFDKYEDAVKVREEAEVKYFGEYRRMS